MSGASVQERLVFLISAPRAGSTLLTRILLATGQLDSRPEPHLLTPLAHLGYWDAVERAPYDPWVSQQAIRRFVAALPAGEDDYVDACRAYADTLYGRMLARPEAAGRAFFLDKTPAYGLILPFLQRLYPRARYIVLTRHPAAVFASYAESFFAGDYAEAARFNPILSRYIPPIAAFLRAPPSPERCLHLRYEDLVTDPEAALARIGALLGLHLSPSALHYQRVSTRGEPGWGDPITVEARTGPVTDSVDRWTAAIVDHPDRFEVIARQLAGVAAEDLEAWGYPREALWTPLAEADPAAWRGQHRRRWQRYRWERRLLVALRRDIHRRPLGRVLRQVRAGCDVLLRG